MSSYMICIREKIFRTDDDTFRTEISRNMIKANDDFNWSDWLVILKKIVLNV